MTYALRCEGGPYHGYAEDLDVYPPPGTLDVRGCSYWLDAIYKTDGVPTVAIYKPEVQT